jgi:hypothetical protein
MRGAIPLLSNTPSWRGAWLSTGTTYELSEPSGETLSLRHKTYDTLATLSGIKPIAFG